MKDIRVAMVVFRSPVGNTRRNLDRMARRIMEAKKKGASFICFPEMNITGYDIHGSVRDAAVPVPGPVTQELLRRSESEQMVILAGIAERDEQGRVFASHLVLTPDGRTELYRKPHVAPPERAVFTAGERICLFEAEGIRFGIQLCYDAHFPELSTRLAMQGAEIIFIPHASPRGTPAEKLESWMRHLPARAFDNGLFVLACNQTGDNGRGLSFPGIALAIGPSGQVLKKRVSAKEGVMIVDLKEKDLVRVRNHPMRFFLPNRRPDLFGF